MKLKLFFLILTSFIFVNQVQAQDAGFRFIINNGKIKCGTNLSSKIYAYKNEAGIWQGIDADICKVFALAIFGDSSKIEMRHVEPSQISNALGSNKIDIMISSGNSNASDEINSKSNIADILYYDQQKFMTKKDDTKSSLLDYKGSTICSIKDSANFYNIEEFNKKYNLELKQLPQRNYQSAKEAFLLKRCDLISDGEFNLTSIKESPGIKNLEIIPDIIAVQPVYIHTNKQNQKLNSAAKWIVNALKLCEKHDINSTNIDIMIGIDNTSLNNLLGNNEQLWKSMKLQPKWVKAALKEVGNFAEIYERNLGKDSEYNFDRSYNKLVKDGGLLDATPFL